MHTSRGVQSQRRAGTHSLPVTVTPSTAHSRRQGVRTHAATCICILESASLREDSECRTWQMQSIREHRSKQKKKKNWERKQNKPGHLKQKDNHSTTLVEKKRCNPGGQKRCQIDHAYAVQPVPGIKEEKLIFFFFLKLNSLRWRMTHTVSQPEDDVWGGEGEKKRKTWHKRRKFSNFQTHFKELQGLSCLV